jgi:hypothetical protein
MNVLLARRDWIGFSVATLGILSLMVAGWFTVGTLAIGVALSLEIAVVLFILLQNRRENRQQFEQVEDLLGLYFSLPEGPPLPKTRGWAASPDFLRLVYGRIRKEKPGLVVELGSGSSTVVGGYALQQNGSGRLVSFEHLEKYVRQSREMVSFHSLDDYSQVLEAPLTDYTLNGEGWKWYSLKNFDPEETVDLVIVDGPPGGLQDLSRYPALPLLSEWLSEEATFIVDDGDRKDEEAIVKRWMEENPKLTLKYRDTEKGAYITSE